MSGRQEDNQRAGYRRKPHQEAEISSRECSGGAGWKIKRGAQLRNKPGQEAERSNKVTLKEKTGGKGEEVLGQGKPCLFPGADGYMGEMEGQLTPASHSGDTKLGEV